MAASLSTLLSTDGRNARDEKGKGEKARGKGGKKEGKKWEERGKRMRRGEKREEVQ